jgi:hypothetical protein
MSKKQFLDHVLDELRELCKLTLTHREQITGKTERAAIAIARQNANDWNQTAISVSEAADLALELARV